MHLDNLATSTARSRYSSLRRTSFLPDPHARDGSERVDALHAPTIPAVCRSARAETLVRTYVNCAPVYLDAKSARRLTARCSKCHGLLKGKPAGIRRTFGELPERREHGLPRAFLFVAKLGYGLLGCVHTPMRRCRWMLLPSLSRLGYSERSIFTY